MDWRNNFDALRLVAALSVIVSHAYLLGEGSEAGDPLMLLSGGQCPLGVVGVFVFFAISGYLVTQSYEATGAALPFLAKRGLRVYPGLLACLLVSAFILGPAVTALPLAAYLAHPEGWGYVLANLAMNTNWNGLAGVRFSDFESGAIIDGPLWSLPAELAMYLMVAALGARRLLTLPAMLALIAIGIACLSLDTAQSDAVLMTAGWLLSFFAAGMALYRLRRRAIFDFRLALLAGAILLASLWLGGFVLLFPIAGSYLVIYLARHPRLPFIRAARFGDLSYGLYIYGWPVEQLAVRLLGGAAPWWLVFAIAAPVSAGIAFLSWHLVEQPALRLKPATRTAMQPLPATAG